jgi:uncharacterized protein YjiS (DUF1127 family)
VDARIKSAQDELGLIPVNAQPVILARKTPPDIPAVSWNTVMRLCRQGRVHAAMWRSRARQRRALARLDDRLLADIGLTREAQMLECSKLFWWHS